METSQQYPTVLEYHGYQVVATSPSPPRPFIIVPPARRRTRVVVRLVPQEVREGVEDALLQPVAAKLARLPFVIALIPLLAIANVARRHLQNVGQKQPQNQHRRGQHSGLSVVVCRCCRRHCRHDGSTPFEWRLQRRRGQAVRHSGWPPLSAGSQRIA